MAKGNLAFHKHTIVKAHRAELLGQTPIVLWFTGLSGSGKSTIAGLLEEMLNEQGFATYLLDGDNIRYGLNKDLGFTGEERKENIRRIGEVSKLFLDAGLIVLAAFISPFAEDRKMVRELVEEGEFMEIYVNCPIEVAEQRDTKSLYKKARAGELKDFTGIDSPYEAPTHPEIEIRSEEMSAEGAAQKILKKVLPLIQPKDEE
jgi:adenylyl-sulfate kinase